MARDTPLALGSCLGCSSRLQNSKMLRLRADAVLGDEVVKPGVPRPHSHL